MGLDPASSAEPAEPDQGQWTQVRPKKGRARPRPLPDSQTTPPNPVPQLDTQQIAADHGRIASTWDGTSTCIARLRDLMRHHAPAHAPLRRAVCLGIGSFDPAPHLSGQKRVAHVQLEAFRAMVEALETLPGSLPIQRVVQEPAFTAADEEFCRSLGFQVVSTPDAFSMIDSHTLVYGIHLYIPTWVDAFRKELPGCWVGARLEDCEAYCDSRDVGLDIGRIRAMDQSYDKFAFPQEAGDFTFSGTCIYWVRGEVASK